MLEPDLALAVVGHQRLDCAGMSVGHVDLAATASTGRPLDDAHGCPDAQGTPQCQPGSVKVKLPVEDGNLEPAGSRVRYRVSKCFRRCFPPVLVGPPVGGAGIGSDDTLEEQVLGLEM